MSSADDGLPPLREVIAQHGLQAKKNLGQNFLFDFNLLRRIARAAGAAPHTKVIEVGPGPGGLTRALLMEGAGEVIAIERDDRALPVLTEISEHYPGRLRIISGDALALDLAALSTGPTQIVANLPYNIATPLLTGWLTSEVWPPWFSSLTLMLQKEVVERLVAKPGSKTYGRLSVLAQWRAEVKKLFDVNRSAFIPSPKVTSAIVQIVPRPMLADDCRCAALEKITAAAFGQRRKMLRAALRGVFADPIETLTRLGIAPEARAEELPVSAFVALAREWDARRKD